MSNPEQPVQENLADIKEPQQQNVEGLEAAKTEELKNVVDAANVVAGKIERDENVTEGDVLDLEEALGKIKIEFYGEQLTPKEVSQIPDLKQNIKMFNRILTRKRNLLPEDLEFPDFLSYLPPEIAQIISIKYFGNHYIYLDGLTSLSSESARYLANWHGEVISFRKLKKISDDTAEQLSRFQGSIFNVSQEIKDQINKFKSKK